MVGLQSLAPGQAPMPGQGQMAGQPAMPGMLPKPQGVQPGVQALVPSLVGMDMGRLLQMFADPNNPVPKNRILAAMTEKQKEMAARQAVQGQMAMAQAQQQPGTVKDQVVQGAMQAAQPPQMAAHGGVMRGYAGGGAVAFQSGGNMLVEQILKKSPYERTPEENEILRAAGVEVTRKSLPQEGGVSALNRLLEAPFIRRLFTGDTYKLSPEELAKRTDTGATTERMFRALGGSQFVEPTVAPAAAEQSTDTGDEVARLLGRAPAPVLMRDTRGAAPTPPAPSGGQRRQPSAAPAPATQPALAPQAGLSPEMEAYFRNRASDLRTRQGLPEDIVSGRAGLESLARENIAAQRGEAETFGREARERRDAALARSQRGLLDDPQALLALAGGIDTRRGQGIGSLARGAAGLMSQREAAAEAARKEYATAQQTERALQANVRQATMLEAQRAQALREGDFNRANQIKDQIDALMMQRETLLMERKDKAIEQTRLERGLNIQERGVRAQETSANKPTAREFEYALFKTDPEKYKAFLAAGAEPKSEGAMLKEIVSAALKNPLMLQQYPPAIQALVNQELLKLGVTSALPKGAGVRE